jgi:hypothetical protein
MKSPRAILDSLIAGAYWCSEGAIYNEYNKLDSRTLAFEYFSTYMMLCKATPFQMYNPTSYSIVVGSRNDDFAP